jgi:hypothetical protein
VAMQTIPRVFTAVWLTDGLCFCKILFRNCVYGAWGRGRLMHGGRHSSSEIEHHAVVVVKAEVVADAGGATACRLLALMS